MLDKLWLLGAERNYPRQQTFLGLENRRAHLTFIACSTAGSTSFALFSAVLDNGSYLYFLTSVLGDNVLFVTICRSVVNVSSLSEREETLWG